MFLLCLAVLGCACLGFSSEMGLECWTLEVARRLSGAQSAIQPFGNGRDMPWWLAWVWPYMGDVEVKTG